MGSKYTDREERSKFEADMENKDLRQREYHALQEQVERWADVCRRLSMSSIQMLDRKQYALFYFFLLEEMHPAIDDMAEAAGLEVGPSANIHGFPVCDIRCNRCDGDGVIVPKGPVEKLEKCGLCLGTGKKMVRTAKDLGLIFNFHSSG